MQYADLVRRMGALLEEDPSELGAHDDLLDWGLDSIRMMNLVEELKDEGFEVSLIELTREPTLAHFARCLGLEVAEAATQPVGGR